MNALDTWLVTGRSIHEDEQARQGEHLKTAETPLAWLPVPIRWRWLRAGDQFLGADGRPWHAVRVRPDGTVTAVSGEQSFTGTPDPDDAITVLIPVSESEAVELTRDQLGARLIERRTS